MIDLRHRLAMRLHRRGHHLLCRVSRPDITGLGLSQFTIVEIHR